MHLMIGTNAVGLQQPCFVIAEAGVNHNGDVGSAKKLIDVAVDAKADAVKFQSFRSELLAKASPRKADYQIATTGQAASLEPRELAALTSGIRAAEASLGSPIKEAQACELTNRVAGRRSLAAKRDLPAGTVLSESDLIEMRPATGVAPGMQALVVGRSLRRALGRGEILNWQDVS